MAGFFAIAALASESELGSIELIRDEWGVPHIFADTDAGAFYGAGYAVAEDRIIQMELSRRFIRGRMSELLGDVPLSRRGQTTVSRDRYMRIVGYGRHADKVIQNIDADTRSLLQAYSDGVNAYVRKHPERLKGFLDRASLEPEPWTPADCIACWTRLGSFFSGDGLNDARGAPGAARGRNVARAGRGEGRARDAASTGRTRGRDAARPRANTRERQRTSRPEPTRVFDDSAAVVKRGDIDEAWMQRVLDFAEEHGYAKKPPADSESKSPKFSHAWVVGGDRTTTGSAVLVSDPQTPVRLPSAFHEFHLKGATIDARGIGAPGSPSILIGWTPNVAWGATALGADQADLFLLKTDEEHPNQYSFDGEWKPMRVIEETIKVRDGDSVKLRARETHLGPVVTGLIPENQRKGEYALRRIPLALEDQVTAQGCIALMRARDVEEAGKALERWSFPSCNLVLGDKDGGIAYWMQGALPVRSRNSKEGGRAVQDGTGSEHAWQDYIPHDLAPHVFNPKQGWIVSANHRPVEAWYPSQQPGGTGSLGHTTRSWRLYELMQAEKGKMSPQDVFDMHFDAVNPAKRTIVRAGIELSKNSQDPLSEAALRAIDFVKPWYENGAKSITSEAGYPVVHHMGTMFRFAGSPLARFGGGASGLTNFCRYVNQCLDDGEAGEFAELERKFIDDALAGGVRRCVQLYGEDPSTWSEGLCTSLEARKIGYMVSLDGLPSLDPSLDTTFPGLQVFDGNTIQAQAGEAYTQFVSLADVDEAKSILPMGNSEDPDSPYYMNLREAWARGDLHPAPISRAEVEKHAVSTLDLTP